MTSAIPCAMKNKDSPFRHRRRNKIDNGPKRDNVNYWTACENKRCVYINTYSRTERYASYTVAVVFKESGLAFFLHRNFCRKPSILIFRTAHYCEQRNTVVKRVT